MLADSRSSCRFDLSEDKHNFPRAEPYLLNDDTEFSDRSDYSEAYFQDINGEGDTEEDGVGQDIPPDSISHESALQCLDDISPSLPHHLLQENSVRSNFERGGGGQQMSNGLFKTNALSKPSKLIGKVTLLFPIPLSLFFKIPVLFPSQILGVRLKIPKECRILPWGLQ